MLLATCVQASPLLRDSIIEKDIITRFRENYWTHRVDLFGMHTELHVATAVDDQRLAQLLEDLLLRRVDAEHVGRREVGIPNRQPLCLGSAEHRTFQGQRELLGRDLDLRVGASG